MDRGPAVREAAGGRGVAEGTAFVPVNEAFQGWGSRWYATDGAVRTWKAQPGIAYGGSVTHLVSPRLSSRRATRSGQRIADRRCASAGGDQDAIPPGRITDSLTPASPPPLPALGGGARRIAGRCPTRRRRCTGGS
ncbi:MAG: hypothetical protein M0008_04615 [Actinomycetota bacterium]|nr:hypothetical protein [Actinomycetota bacterium]